VNIGSIQWMALKKGITEYVLFNTLFSAICKMYAVRFELNNKRQLHMCHLYSSGPAEVFATGIKIPRSPVNQDLQKEMITQSRTVLLIRGQR